MPTVGKAIADKIKAGNGHYADDTRVLRIVEYDNAFGGVSYGLEYSPKRVYLESPFVMNPRDYFVAS